MPREPTCIEALRLTPVMPAGASVARRRVLRAMRAPGPLGAVATKKARGGAPLVLPEGDSLE